MKNINFTKLLLINLFLIGLLFVISCKEVKEDTRNPINFALLDLFINSPELDSAGFSIGIEQINFIFELENKTHENYYLLFDNWLKDSSDVTRFYIKKKCQNNLDSSELNLAYITSPIQLLPKNSLDTLVLKVDFREFRTFKKNCIGEYSEEMLKQKLSEFILIAENKKNLTKIIRKNDTFSPVNNFAISISGFKKNRKE